MTCAVVAFLLVAVPLFIGFIRTATQIAAPGPAQPTTVPGAATARPSPTAAASTAFPPPTPGPTPTPNTPPPTSDTEPPPTPDRSLKKNSIYTIDLGGTRVRCSVRVRSAKPPVANSNLAPYLRTLMKCMVKAFKKPLAEEGFELTTPKVKVYRKTIKSPCGKLGQNAAPAYYCPTDRTVYWPATRDDGNEAYTFARLGYIGLAAHEFGHHLQSVTGMSYEYGTRYYETDSAKGRYLLSRRLELQAQCFEGVFLRTVAGSIDLSSYDRSQIRLWHDFTGDEDPPASRKPDHGTSSAQVRWLFRGLDSQDFGKCNTWKASRRSVK